MMETHNKKGKIKKLKRIKLGRNEKVVILPTRRTPKGIKYAVTNYGRVISFTKIPVEGNILKLGKIKKFFGASVGRKTFLIHRLVAMHFLKRAHTNHRFVIHLDFDNSNNYFKNLKWVNRDEMEAHQLRNPHRKKRGNQKLTIELVKKIKQKIKEGKMTLRMIGNQYGVTDMQIHRIKTGENWGHVKI